MAIFQIEMFSRSLKHLTSVAAILPADKPSIPGAAAAPADERPFRTIYLLHGHSGSQLDWITMTRITQLAALYNVAVIMPSCGNGFYLDDEILGEYCEKYICEELVDFTRRVFPLSRKTEDTTLAGLSMGGYGAMRNGLKHGEVFGSIFAFSSALITDMVAGMKEGDTDPVAPFSYYKHVFGEPATVIGSDRDPKALAEMAVSQKLAIPKIFMACGSEDFLISSNRDLHEHLIRCGISHEYLESPGVHEWRLWDDYIEKAMTWLYGKPEIPVSRERSR